MLKNLLSKFFVITGIAILLSLGAWQLMRMSEKEDLISDLKARSSMPVITPYDFSDKYFYRNIEVCGHFEKNKDLFVYFKPNYLIVSPFHIKSSGKNILVARGIVKNKDKENRSILTTDDKSTCISGILAPPERKPIFMPEYDGSPQKPMLSINPKSAEKLIGIELYNMYMISIEDSGSEFISKIKTPNPENIYNNHLEYAITWFTLAGILFFMFVTSFKNSNSKNTKN